MGRTGWLAVVGLALMLGVLVLRLRSTPRAPALDCPPDQVRWEGEGERRIARCGPGHAGPVPQQLTIGQHVDLNAASAEQLAELPGVGPSLAHAIVHARPDGGFVSWDQVDQVPGVGPAKLEQLEQVGSLGPSK